MRRAKCMIFVLSFALMYAVNALSLDLEGVLRGAAGQVIDNAMRGASSSNQRDRNYQQQHSQPQQETQTYTYEEYMAANSDDVNSSNENTVTQTEGDFDPENPFASLGGEDEQPDANADSRSGGQEPGTIEVVATGIGQDSDQALRNALRAAIEQAVGIMVDSETLAQNDEVINDQILSYSAGFVESHKVIGEPRTRDGLVSIKIQAQVKRTQLREKLSAANIHIKEIDGQSLFGEAITKIEQGQAAKEILSEIFTGFPEGVMYAKLAGKPSYNDGKIQLKCEVGIDRQKYSDYLRTIQPKINELCDKKIDIMTTPKISHDVMYIDQISFHNLDAMAMAICRQMNDSRSNAMWDIYYFSEENILSAMRNMNIPKLRVEVKDKINNTVTGGEYNIPVPFIASNVNGKPHLSVAPVLCYTDSRQAGYMTPGTYTESFLIEFTASPDEIKTMNNVVMTISKGGLLSELSNYGNVVR